MVVFSALFNPSPMCLQNFPLAILYLTHPVLLSQKKQLVAWNTKMHRVDMCVCMFSSHSFWTSSSLDAPARVTQEEGHTGFLIHLLSAVRALIFLARRIQPFLSLVDCEIKFCVLTI